MNKILVLLFKIENLCGYNLLCKSNINKMALYEKNINTIDAFLNRDIGLYSFERIKLIYYILNDNIHELDFIEYFKASEYKLEIDLHIDESIIEPGAGIKVLLETIENLKINSIPITCSIFPVPIYTPESDPVFLLKMD